MIFINVSPLVLLLTGTLGLPKRYCLNPDEYPFPRTGKYGQCVLPDLYPTGKYCYDQSQCEASETCKAVEEVEVIQPRLRCCRSDDKCGSNEKCAATGSPDQGVCKPKTDPTGKYIASETVIVAGTSWRSAKIMNVKNSYQVKIH